MTDPEFSAVIVTRGDVSLGSIVEHLLTGPVSEVVIWDNSKRPDMRVFGRYVGGLLAKHPVVYVQDDDCLVDVEAIWHAYEPGIVTTNMPMNRRAQYPVGALVGWGQSLIGRCLCMRSIGTWNGIPRMTFSSASVIGS